MLERHPVGLEFALSEMYQQCRLPIYLTEHGSSSTDEAFRERDLRENLAAAQVTLSPHVQAKLDGIAAAAATMKH